MRQTWVRELCGWLAAVLIAVVTVAQVATTARADLLFRDSDSLVVALLVRSVSEGESFDWVMSSVLFLPEIVVFGLLWMLGRVFALDVNAVFVINAVVNLTALYGAVRLAAGRRREGSAPVAWSLLAVSMFGVLAMTETSASRDSLELASLLATTTYYSATVIAVVLSIGIVRRVFDGTVRVRWRLPAVLGVIAAVSTLSNPLYAAWATVPLGLLLGVSAVYQRSRGHAIPLFVWIVGGTAAGFVARIPLSEWIANDGSAYAQPTLWPQSVRYYGELLAERLSAPLGALGAVLLTALLLLAIVQSVRAPTRGARVVAVAAWLLPVLVAVGAVALGTHAARYLEPVAFAPILGLVASPRALRVPQRAVVAMTAGAGVLLVVGAGLSTPRVAATAQHPNADLTCVSEWVNASGQVGAGQFWTVRLPKLHLDDPSQLIQVDHQLNAYAWLINRSDFEAGEVTFLIEDAQSTSWALGTNAMPTDVIACGQYTIYDFSPVALPLGPARS
ncbi:hypothetical protein [Microbacterium murale]|uniref:Glycosyltransferase RgtA/B/C/D-like domain-containing protein n=1 Tax=Microbacterium murale TaxID=1081040 RepID=A0ABU0P8E0_9MICO|nr:hypothetical protein [Microbacterium murale]MDQ0643606.1 hypothetical protein [Microbacterium murale]